MNTQSLETETRNELMALINKWGARWRLRRVVLYLPRIVMLTSLAGIIVAILSALTGALSPSMLLVITAIAMTVTFVIVTSALGLFSKKGYEAARQFEALFNLQERISTALEILDGRIKTSPEIAQRQLEDAYEIAKSIDPRKQIPLKVKWWEWLAATGMVLIFVIALAFTLFLTVQRSTAVSAETQAAITNAANATRDITSDIATDSGLTDEERTSLLESAEATLDDLENPDLSAEDSFVAMSDLESDLREQVEALRDETEQSEQGLEAASDALGNLPEQSPEDNAGDSLAEQLEQAAENAPGQSDEEQQSLSDALREAADQVREENPELAQQLEDAADQLENGNTEEFNSAMDEAAQESRSSGEQNQQRSETADSLEQSAEQAQQAASEIAQSEQQQGQQGQPQQEGQQQQQGQQQGQPQQGDQSQQQGQGQDPDSQQQGEDGAEVQSENAENASSQASDQQSQAQSQSQSQQSAESQESGEGGGAGNSTTDQRTQEITGVGEMNQTGETDNDGGESEFDPVFAPDPANIQRGDTNVELNTDESNEQTVEGDFQENPNGESTVPYNQVFSTYSDAASSALENGYVPLGVRDVVRDYFTSLEPTGNQNTGE